MPEWKEGSAALRDAERGRAEAQAQLQEARSLAPQIAALREQLAAMRETNHFHESFTAFLREQGHGRG